MKKIKQIIKNNSKLILGIMLGLIWSSGIAYAATILFDSDEASYDNTTSNLQSTNVQDALDELYIESTSYQLFESRVSTLEDKFDDYIIVRTVSGSIKKTYGQSTSLTAPTISGYTFLTWYHCETSGWIGSIYVENPSHITSSVFLATKLSETNYGSMFCSALYIKS